MIVSIIIKGTHLKLIFICTPGYERKGKGEMGKTVARNNKETAFAKDMQVMEQSNQKVVK